MPIHQQAAEMESDYEYDYDDDDFPESDEDMASGDDYEFDAQAELQSAAKKACCLCARLHGNSWTALCS